MAPSEALARSDRQQIHHLFSAYRHFQDRALRAQLVLAHAPLARYLARRFADRGEPVEDLIQVAAISLSQELGRTPTIDEIAREGGVRLGTAIEAFEVGRAYNSASLDARGEGDEECERLGADDPAIQEAEDRVSLERAIRCLPERLQAAIRMRYFHGLGRAEVARRLGTSPMCVSRLQR